MEEIKAVAHNSFLLVSVPSLLQPPLLTLQPTSLLFQCEPERTGPGGPPGFSIRLGLLGHLSLWTGHLLDPELISMQPTIVGLLNTYCVNKQDVFS